MTYYEPAPVILVDSTGTAYSASGGGGGGNSSVNITQVGGNAVSTSVPVTIASVTGTVPISAASLPLPAGAATDATFAPTTSTSTNLAALNALVAYVPGRKGTTIVQVTGTFVATLSLLGTVDGTNYVTFGSTPQFLNLNTGAYTATITTAGIYQTSSNGLVGAQIKATAFTSGTAVVTVSSSDIPAMMALDAAIPAGTNSIGSVVLAAGSATAGNVQVTGSGGVGATKASATAPATTDISVVVTASPNYVASASASVVANLASTTNATSVKTSAGSIMVMDISNYSGATIYVKLYNKASAPTVGTDTPVLVIPVATGAATVTEFGQYGKRFTTGIAYATTTAVADTDTTAITSVAATPVKVGITYL